MQEQLRALIEQHCVTLRTTLREIENRILPNGDASAPGQADIERALDLAHQMKGSSGSIGFDEVSRRAGLFEDELKSLHAANACDAGTKLGRAAVERFDGLKSLVDGLAPEQSRLFDADLSRLVTKDAKTA